MRRDNWKVIEGDNRPAGRPDECFYCNKKHGEEHAEGCVVRVRTVVIRTVVEHVVEVPEDWDENSINFKHNESSSCCDNIISDLGDLADRLENMGSCTCHLVKSEYVREATEADEESNAWPKTPRVQN